MHKTGDYRGHIYPGYQDTRPGAVNTLGGRRWRRSAGRQAGSDATGRRQAIATSRPAPARPSHARPFEACTSRPERQTAGQQADQRQAIATSRRQASGSHTHTHPHTRSRQQQAAGHRHSQTNGRPSPAPRHQHTQAQRPARPTATASPPRPQAKRPPAKQHARSHEYPHPMPLPHRRRVLLTRAHTFAGSRAQNFFRCEQKIAFPAARAKKWRGVKKTERAFRGAADLIWNRARA